ncbi:MAG: peptidoglycan DD-metalloendopeptidase family protein [Rhodospirillales bacterium]|nr:peptidoglycan DD-metalloendopeptidase family protein [Rhodospirillales bacterium]HJO71281.1 peptidoglycan DD-metalloendopeptidase family protein [Rhodospirillales bacterium]
MLLRGLLAAGVALSAVVISANLFVYDPSAAGDGWPATSGTDGTDGMAATLAMAPISLGNPAAALSTRHPVALRQGVAATAPYTQILHIGRGDILGSLLVEAGIDADDAVAAIAALGGVFDPRRIRPGQAVAVTFAPVPGIPAPGRFLGFELNLDFARAVVVGRAASGGFTAHQHKKALTRELAAAADTIDDSLFADATRAGVPVPVLVEMVRAYSWDVDFQRDIRPGDRFEVMYERFFEDGRKVHERGVVYAQLTLSGKRLAIYRFTGDDKRTDYYDANGQSARKALMRTPIDGARLSSGFGRRKHPILGYTKMHRGLDFAAPRGTPIYAAGNGRVEVAGRNGAYGKYVRIRHNAGYSTAYAHLKGFARGMRLGKRVTQGEIIGYVGTTGRSTGPHLHYEILKGGRRANPLSVKMPSGRKLKGVELARFDEARAAIEARYAGLAGTARVAAGGDQAVSP